MGRGGAFFDAAKGGKVRFYQTCPTSSVPEASSSRVGCWRNHAGQGACRRSLFGLNCSWGTPHVGNRFRGGLSTAVRNRCMELGPWREAPCDPSKDPRRQQIFLRRKLTRRDRGGTSAWMWAHDLRRWGQHASFLRRCFAQTSGRAPVNFSKSYSQSW